MTKTILAFPAVTCRRLSCVWIKTENPAQPLACRWVDHTLNTVANDKGNESEPYRLCA